jgi:hypothetical protein
MALIGISGYAGTGKDEVGAIIQKLTAATPLDSSQEWDWTLFTTWEIKKWAGKLKQVASFLTSISVEKFEDQEFKKTNLNTEWSLNNSPMSVRDFLQKMGTDGLRNGLHPNVWVNALMADYKAIDYNDDEQPELPNWVITDTRFINEAIAIKNAGGIVIRIDRPGVKPINNHPSEIELDNWNFDYKIANVSDLIALKASVLTILKKENLL